MKQVLFFIALLPYMGSAQNESDLYGSWKFDNIEANIPNGDEKKRAAAENLMKTMHITFYPDNTYEGRMMNIIERGKYRLEGDLITFNNTIEGNAKQYTVKFIKAGQEDITLGYSMNVILKREPITQEKELLIREWELKVIKNISDEEDEEDQMVPQAKGNFIAFKADGTYSFVIGSNRESGYWAVRYKEEKVILVLNSNNTIKYWSIINSSNNELVLALNDIGQHFIFTAN